MANYRTLSGILVLVDIVNFTPQAAKLGDANMRRYLEYFKDKMKAIGERRKFKIIKTLGDALLLFGHDPEELLEIILDIFKREKLEDKYGFRSQLRIVGHFGFFQFEMENNSPVDLVSAEGIKVFRLEKQVQSWEVVVTGELFRGLKELLTGKNLEWVKIHLEEPLKGFDNKDWSPPFYKLTIIKGETSFSNLLEQTMEKLEKDVQHIQVFGNIYPPVPMDRNFINLTLICDREEETALDESLGGERDVFTKSRINAEGKSIPQWPFIDEMDKSRWRRWDQLNVQELYENFQKGVIIGLPGAGKTTILRHLAYKEFKANSEILMEDRSLVMFIPCRNVPNYDEWYKTMYSSQPSSPGIIEALEFMTWVFLFGRAMGDEVVPDKLVEFRNAVKKVKSAFESGRLTLLVDALDEGPEVYIRERVMQLFTVLYRELKDKSHRDGCRIFLSSRPSEKVHLSAIVKKEKIPRFRVQNLTMEQVRAVAQQLMEVDSPVYKRFDEAIWEEETVAKMAATPITALLLAAYFMAYYQFEHRYPMYDLLVKFILLKVWEAIKINKFRYNNLGLFFQECRSPDFFKNHPETHIFYDALASLCFELFFDSPGGKIQRFLKEKTLVDHFEYFIRQRRHCINEAEVKSEAKQWRERFFRDHLLLAAGPQEYVFVHSTVMEFLAGYYLVQEYGRDQNKLRRLMLKCIQSENCLELETLSIAAGSSLSTGYALLECLQYLRTQVSYSPELVCELGLRCLAEVEWLLEKELSHLQTRKLQQQVLDIVTANESAVHWVFDYLKRIVLSTNKNSLVGARERFEQHLRLIRPTFLDEYMTYKEFDDGDSETVDLRKGLLVKIVQDKLVEEWLKKHGSEFDYYENVLQLDTSKYHPEDKNYNYFHKLMGPRLTGFLGSPNLRHLKAVRSCAFSPDESCFVSSSEDGTLKLWDTATGKEIHTFYGHKGFVFYCAFSPDGNKVLSASGDNTLKMWDVVTGKEILTFKGHNDIVYNCTFSPDGYTVLSSSSDYTLKLWDVFTGKEMHTFFGHRYFVLGCDFSPDGTTILSASDDQSIKIWDVASGKDIRTLSGHKERVYKCVFSPDGTTFLTASSDNTLKLWDVDSGEKIHTFSGHKERVLGCAFSRDGTAVLSASCDNTLKLWDVVSGKEKRTFYGHVGWGYEGAFNLDGTIILSASSDSTLKLWEVISGKDIRTFSSHRDSVMKCAFSPDGTAIISASSDSTIKLWDTLSGKEMHTFYGHKDAVQSCAFSPDGTRVLSASCDNTLKLWDVATGKEIRTFTGHDSFIYGCTFYPDGKMILSASHDRTLKVWEVGYGRERRLYCGHSGSVLCCAFSSDATTILSASSDNTLKLWDVNSEKEIYTFTGHDGSVYSCAYSPDTTKALSSSEDKTIKLWDLSSGKCICTFSGHEDPVWNCTFSPDGSYILSVSGDSTLRIWDIKTGDEVKSMRIKMPWPARSVDVSHEGKVVTANANGTLTLFDFPEFKVNEPK